MRKIIGTVLLTIPLTILITLLALNIALKDMMGDIIGSTWKSLIPSISYNDGNYIDDFSSYMNDALEDSDIEDLWGQLQEEFGEDGGAIQEFIDQNKNKLEEITGIDFNTETIEKITEALENKDYGELFGELIESQEKKLTPGQRFGLKFLKFIVQSGTRGILIICIIVNLVLIALVQFSFYKWIKALAWATILGGGLLLGLGYGFTSLLGKMNLNFSMDNIMKNAIYMIILGVVVRILYFVILTVIKNMKDDKKGKKEVNEVS